MNFSETFQDLRKRRRIPMRLFEKRAGIPPSYVHDIEKKGLLPGPDRLADIVAVFREVAEQQRSDAEEDVRLLEHAHANTLLVDRLGLDRDLADVLTLVRELEPRHRGDLLRTLRVSVPVFQHMNQMERRALTRTILNVVEFTAEFGEEDWQGTLIDLSQKLNDSMDELRVERRSERKTPPPAPARRRQMRVATAKK
jgi:transcriptional regulator with XRE-family HTH domain